MDEPSAVLGENDLEHLFQVVRSLQAQGIGIVYISHRMREIFELADEVTVLKDGRYVATRPVAEVNMDELVRLMIGRDLKDVYPRRDVPPGEVLLDVKGLRRHHLVHDVSFQVRAGEIVGFAGITGSGRTEVVRAIFGADAHDAELRVAGVPYKARSPTDAIGRGIALINEDRKAHGLFLKQSVTINTTISSLGSLCWAGIIRFARERTVVQKAIQDLRVKTPSADFIVVNMSGGNQQKVILARWLLADTKGPHHGRADPWHRRGEQGGDLRDHERAHSARRGNHHDLLGAARGAGHERPRPRDAGGNDRRRAAARRGDRGGHHEVRRRGRAATLMTEAWPHLVGTQRYAWSGR